MTSFSLPIVEAENKPVFHDARSATDWLAGQPQANASAMLFELVKQIDAVNRHNLPARERFKILEVLRSVVFGVSGECQRRYENKPLPLLAAEQDVLDATLALWCASRVGYLHCLQACLELDASVADHAAEITHRVFACLRMEQKSYYLASAELDGDFWQAAHSAWAATEQLGVTREPIEDRLLGETSESTATGQYCMLMLLHLAVPFSLAPVQLAAVIRWLARWREQAMVLSNPQSNAKSRAFSIDLSRNLPVSEGSVGGNMRWLAVDDIVRKIRQRLELLAAGETPEALKLGAGIPADACIALLRVLFERLKHPAAAVSETAPATSAVSVAAGFETIHRLLAGRGIDDPDAVSAFGNRLSLDQISVFGHVVEKTKDTNDRPPETWQLARGEAQVVHLRRPPSSVGARLILNGLVAVQFEPGAGFRLAIINQLRARSDQSLLVVAGLLPTAPEPLVAEIREKPAGKVSRHPAFLLPAERGQSAPSVILPLGLRVRALSIRFHEVETQMRLGYRLLDSLARGGDYERWSITTA